MNCEWREKVFLYADDELAAPALGEVAAHLLKCRECATTLLEQLQMKKLVRQAGQRYSAPPVLRSRIREHLHFGRRQQPLWKWSFAVIPLLLLLAVGLILLPSKSGDPLIGELVDQHVTTLASVNPVDVISSDRHTVKPWFQGRLPFAFNLPELTNSPFTLIGGKSVYVQQNPGAELLYEIRKHRISVFIFQADQHGPEVPASGKDHSFTVESWVEGELRFCLITDATKEDAKSLKTMFQTAYRQ